MFVERHIIEKLLDDNKLLSKEKFQRRCAKQQWASNTYKKIYEKIFNHYGVDLDRNKRNIDKLVNFLNGTDENRCIGPKKRKANASIIELSDDEESFHNVSISSQMSIDQPFEASDALRDLAVAKLELKGLFFSL